MQLYMLLSSLDAFVPEALQDNETPREATSDIVGDTDVPGRDVPEGV